MNAGPAPSLRPTANGLEVVAASYRWQWSAITDLAVLQDATGRRIVAFPLQPCIVVSGEATGGESGRCVGTEIEGGAFTVRYEALNGGGVTLTLRFLPHYFIIEAVTYRTVRTEAVMRLVYFGSRSKGEVRPAAATDVCIIPGGRQDPETVLFPTAELEDVVFSVGCFGLGTGTFHQQWGLPHYLTACYSGDGEKRSGAVCVGLGALPDGNVLVRVNRGHVSYEINFRGDLWGHRSGTSHQFEFPLVFAVGQDWYQAGLAFFEALAQEGYAPKRSPESVPEAASWPQYDTWGDQAARRCMLDRLTEEDLRGIYRDVRASGLRPRLFVIDDKWEDRYGSLEHDPARFPRFLEFLDEVRSDGCEIGLWTAFPRCEDYRALGLTERAVLRRPDGLPHVERQGNRSWYIFDPTDDDAAAYLVERARQLVRAYRPRLVKIDFGYEIPTPDVAGPHDLAWSGERLFLKFLQVVCGALKQENPNIAVLYYCISPLFNDSIDQCGMDDLWMSRGDYAAGFAKRALLSSWCGSFGMVPYGSSGYDWRSADEIWFDTAIIGTLGIIAPLAGDEYGERPTPQQVARYNGIARVTRRNPFFRVELLDARLHDPAHGPRAESWLRVEDNRVVVAALRPRDAKAIAHDLLETDCPVVVASLTDDELWTTPRLAIVPFGTGAVRLHRRGRARASAVARLLGGGSVDVTIWRQRNVLTVEVQTEIDGRPVEVVEVAFA